MAQITLRQLIDKTENEEKNQIDTGASGFQTMCDFLSYFDAHYKPILEQLEEDWSGSKDARRFMARDLLEIFK